MKLSDVVNLKQRANWLEIQTNRCSSKAFCVSEKNKKYFLKIEEIPAGWNISDDYLKVLATDDPYIIKYHIIEKGDLKEWGIEKSLIILTDYLPQRIFLSDFFNQSNYKNRLTICLRFIKSIENIHQKGLLHRDISSPNFLVFEKFKQFFPIITDFNMIVPNEEGEILANPEYLAPEVSSYNDYTVKSEIWSIGILIFYFCTNSFPFGSRLDGLNHDEIKNNVLKQEIDEKLIPIPKVFQGIIKQCLQKDVTKRPDSLTILVKILKREIGWKSYFIV